MTGWAEDGAGSVVVLGSVNVDIIVSAPRLPRAGETVAGIAISRQLGGKGANQAVAAARAGARTLLLGAVGADADGAAMTAALAGHGVDTGAIRIVAGATGCALVVTSPADNQIVCIPGANAAVDNMLAASASIGPGDVFLAQLETPPPATAAFFRRARAAGARTILNAAPAHPAAPDLLALADLLVVNETELALLAGRDTAAAATDAALIAARERLGLAAEQALVVTLGRDGVALVAVGTAARIAAHEVAVRDTTGAGDCFCGYLAAALAQGAGVLDAARAANAAAALAVQTLGAAASIPDRDAVLRLLAA